MSASDNVSFEEALVELDKVVRDLEDGRIGLEDSLRRYEHGVGLLQRCHGQLRQAERRIVELLGADDDGSPRVRPFEHVATVELLREK